MTPTTRSTLRLRPWVIGIAVVCSPALAAAESDVTPYPACTRVPTDGDTAAAKGAFQAGNASFNEADYERAINYWEDAYRRDCTAHANLLNLARAYELNAQKMHAVNALETYLARKPGSPDEDQIKRRIEKLREQQSAETAPVVAPPVEAAPAVVPAAVMPPVEASAPVTTSKRSIVPLVVAGAGGVVAIVGGVLYANARSDFNDAEDKCISHQNCPDDVAREGNDANSRSKVGGWVMGAGGVVLVGGVVWYFVQKPTVTTVAGGAHGVFAHVTPSVAPGYGGLHVFGTF